MRDFLAFCTLMACLVVFVAACIALFKPLPKLKMVTKMQAFKGFGVSLGLFILTAIIIPKPDQPAAAAIAKSAEAPVTNKAEAGPSKASAASAKVFYDGVMGALRPCDKAGNALAEAAQQLQTGKASIYDAYGAATKTVEACRASSLNIEDVDVSDDFADEIRRKAKEAISTCQLAAVAKQTGAATMQEILDGDARPSKMQELKERTDASQAGVLACAAQVMTVFVGAGGDLDSLPKSS